MQGLWIFLTALLVAFAAAQPPDPECNKFGKCSFFSVWPSQTHLLTLASPFKTHATLTPSFLR